MATMLNLEKCGVRDIKFCAFRAFGQMEVCVLGSGSVDLGPRGVKITTNSFQDFRGV